MRIRPRTLQDTTEVESLLAEAGLPSEGLQHTEGWVLVEEDRVQGHIALESAGEANVLRSLVVAKDQKGRGLGRALLDFAEAAVAARGPGLRVLRTDSIGDWVLTGCPETLARRAGSAGRARQGGRGEPMRDIGRRTRRSMAKPAAPARRDVPSRAPRRVSALERCPASPCGHFLARHPGWERRGMRGFRDSLFRRGYRPARLDDLPASVRETTQFSGGLCASTPVYVKEN